MVSLDDGESWHAIFRFPTDIVRTVKVAVFNGTLYFVAPEENRLYCFQSLDKVGWANLLYRGSSLFVYPNASGYLNLEIGDYKVKVYSLTPELLNDNPSLEYWDQTVPRDYGLKQNFNGTLKISKNEPLDGNNAFTLQLNGTGELTLYYPNQGNPLIPIKPGQIVTVSFWIKSNITSSGDFGQRLLTYNALFNENQTLNGFLPWKQQPFTAGQHNRYSQFVSSFTVPLNCYHMRVFFGVIFFSPLPAMVSIDCVYVIQNSPSGYRAKVSSYPTLAIFFT